MGQLQHARRFRFLGREASGYDRRSSPKSRSKSSPKIGRCEIDDIYAVSIGYRKSYGRFGTFEPLGSEWGGPMILKGIMNVEDAKISIDMVIETIVMSNHGGDHSLNSAGSSNYW